MVWFAVYTRRTSDGIIISRKMGNFSGGNCQDVVRKICRIQELHVPKNYDRECSCSFETPHPFEPGEFHHHEISVAPLDTMIEV